MMLKISDTIELSISNNEAEKSLTEQSEIMLELKRQLPEGRMKSVKMWGGVLFNAYFQAIIIARGNNYAK